MLMKVVSSQMYEAMKNASCCGSVGNVGGCRNMIDVDESLVGGMYIGRLGVETLAVDDSLVNDAFADVLAVAVFVVVDSLVNDEFVDVLSVAVFVVAVFVVAVLLSVIDSKCFEACCRAYPIAPITTFCSVGKSFKLVVLCRI